MEATNKLKLSIKEQADHEGSRSRIYAITIIHRKAVSGISSGDHAIYPTTITNVLVQASSTMGLRWLLAFLQASLLVYLEGAVVLFACRGLHL